MRYLVQISDDDIDAAAAYRAAAKQFWTTPGNPNFRAEMDRRQNWFALSQVSKIPGERFDPQRYRHQEREIASGNDCLDCDVYFNSTFRPKEPNVGINFDHFEVEIVEIVWRGLVITGVFTDEELLTLIETMGQEFLLEKKNAGGVDGVPFLSRDNPFVVPGPFITRTTG